MCRGLARPIDRHPFELVNVDDQQLLVVDIFYYLVDTICASRGSNASITTRCRTTWRKFRDFQALLINRGISLHIPSYQRKYIYSLQMQYHAITPRGSQIGGMVPGLRVWYLDLGTVP